MTFKIIPWKALLTLLVITLFLLIANITVDTIRLETGGDGRWELIRKFFDFNNEKGIPTLYSVLLLFSSALILFLVGLSKRKTGDSPRYWYGLSFIFLFLSVDEFVEIHEHLIGITARYFHTSGFLYFAWIIPYGLLFIVFSFLYLRFLLSLPRKVMWLFIAAGTIYVTGAIGFESVGGWYIEKHGEENAVYCLLYTCEELLEMLGIDLFIYALLTYVVDQFPYFSIIVREKPVSQVSAASS
ncbi:MAG: peptidase M48 Ste24p [Lewinellaceae bacterium]|nr:hypothetical protein [Lewinella sp.]MCB9280425.1 peptidase M48 Ste24p [Lewinellaceae bacterium]